MTDPLDELMYQAGLTAQGCWDEMDEYDRTAILKFAQLIVQECVQVVKDNTPFPDGEVLIEEWDKGYICAMSDCVHHIREHFGVQE